MATEIVKKAHTIDRLVKALGHALHLVEHNKANCARCREAHKRIRAAIEEAT